MDRLINATVDELLYICADDVQVANIRHQLSIQRKESSATIQRNQLILEKMIAKQARAIANAPLARSGSKEALMVMRAIISDMPEDAE